MIDTSMADKSVASVLATLVARQEITDLSSRYALGIDRCDLKILATVWWPDSLIDFGRGPVNAAQWSKDIMVFLQRINQTQHFMSNFLVWFEAGMKRARTQSYVHAYHEVPGENGIAPGTNGLQEMIMGGRYLDVVECREGEWRILQRRFFLDWNSNRLASAEWSKGLFAGTARGGRWPSDPFYS
jgi:hypothetical protein